MKERPIKYNSEMALARHENRKSQTRRIAENIPLDFKPIHPKYKYYAPICCPYGQVGDILNVLEVLEDGILVYDGDDEIVSIRVERLNDISEGDAEKEGVPHNEDYPIEKYYCSSCQGEGVHGALGSNLGYTEVDCLNCDTYKKRFELLWESIYGKDSWKLNNWVWVIEFKRV